MNTKSIPVPSLSEQGWLNAPDQKVDFLLAHFFEANASQSYLYRGTVNSMQNLIADHGEDIAALCQSITRTLETYFGKYFDNAVVETSHNLADVSNKVTIKMRISVSIGDKTYTVNELIEQVNSKFVRVVKLINDGAA